MADQYTSHSTAFPLSVVNYDVDNHPPVIQRSGSGSKNRVAYVNEEYTYQVASFDQDNDQVIYSATINGYPCYQYGPWHESIINPYTGLVSFTPVVEGIFRITVTAQDMKGAIAKNTRTLYALNKGSWLNHAPVKAANIRSPLIVQAGTYFAMPASFFDPDADQLYYKTNFGSISSDGIFSFNTYYPGLYPVTINSYDLRGGISSLKFLLEVQPYWSSLFGRRQG